MLNGNGKKDKPPLVLESRGRNVRGLESEEAAKAKVKYAGCLPEGVPPTGTTSLALIAITLTAHGGHFAPP